MKNTNWTTYLYILLSVELPDDHIYIPVSETQANPPQENPQANEVPKSTSPSKQDPENHIPKHTARKFIPKQKSIKSPYKHRKSYVPKHWIITPQTPSKPQGIRPEESRNWKSEISQTNPKQSCLHPNQICVSSSPPSTWLLTPSKISTLLGSGPRDWIRKNRSLTCSGNRWDQFVQASYKFSWTLRWWSRVAMFPWHRTWLQLPNNHHNYSRDICPPEMISLLFLCR